MIPILLGIFCSITGAMNPELPLDILEFQFLPIMNAFSLLMMSMTSTQNYPIFKDLLVKYPPNQLIENFFDLSPSNNQPRSADYYMVKHFLDKMWPDPDDCLLRYRLRLLHYATIAKANDLPFSSPYPVFFTHEKDVPYVQVPGKGNFGWSAVSHRAFNRYTLNADLLLEIPAELINDLAIAIPCLLDTYGKSKFETLVHEKELMKKVVKFGLLDYITSRPDDLFKHLLEYGLDGNVEETSSDCRNDEATLTLLLHETNDSNIGKVENLLRRFEFDDIEMVAHTFLASKLDTMFILENLYRAGLSEVLLIYSMIMDGGQKVDINWYTRFNPVEEVTLILGSYQKNLIVSQLNFTNTNPAQKAYYLSLYVAVPPITLSKR